jgi:hypothetical protein
VLLAFFNFLQEVVILHSFVTLDKGIITLPSLKGDMLSCSKSEQDFSKPSLNQSSVASCSDESRILKSLLQIRAEHDAILRGMTKKSDAPANLLSGNCRRVADVLRTLWHADLGTRCQFVDQDLSQLPQNRPG